MPKQKPQKMSRCQALRLALLVLDFEAESPAYPGAIAWTHEIKIARKIISEILDELRQPLSPDPTLERETLVKSARALYHSARDEEDKSVKIKTGVKAGYGIICYMFDEMLDC